MGAPAAVPPDNLSTVVDAVRYRLHAAGRINCCVLTAAIEKTVLDAADLVKPNDLALLLLMSKAVVVVLPGGLIVVYVKVVVFAPWDGSIMQTHPLNTVQLRPRPLHHRWAAEF